MKKIAESFRKLPLDLKISLGLSVLLVFLILAMSLFLIDLFLGIFIGLLLIGFLSLSSFVGLLQSILEKELKRFSNKIYIIRIIFFIISWPNFLYLCWVLYEFNKSF